MDYLPETEKLKMELDKLDSSNGDRLKQYLETHTELTKFSIANNEGDYSQFPDATIGSKLVDIKFGQHGHENCPAYQFPNNLINFVKSQAKTLKRLRIEEFAMDKLFKICSKH
jgi:hypothetical protein